MITLYHGSYIEVTSPKIDKGRQKVDFGQGFYLTILSEQAEKWSRAIAIRKGPNFQPIVSVFTLDYDKVVADGYRIKVFAEYNLEWLDYVVDCRHLGKMQQLYDMVEGGVANDNVIDTVEDYENGRITAEQALGQLRYKKVNHQLCIRNQEVIDQYLHFQNSYKSNL
ncbi:MAG: DUF3990 domain-containing protein [Paludibacteraceae bacterium]|nr:DUF3990 domain-containing protein [Paludibacteraceae bacterium]